MIAFDDGHRLKLKTAYYALRHKAMANLAFEKNALALVVENAVDDVLPLLTPNVAERLAVSGSDRQCAQPPPRRTRRVRCGP